jgi:AraC-like DNA-binding protein
MYVVRQDFGPRIANMVARRLVMPAHRDGGQLQYVEAPVPDVDEGPRLSPLIDRLERRLDDDLEVGMSQRTFFRRFRAMTGLPPAQWIARARVRRARELLETTRASIEQWQSAAASPTLARCGATSQRSWARPPFVTASASGPDKYGIEGSDRPRSAALGNGNDIVDVIDAVDD